MISATANYLAESRKLAGAIPVKLVKIFYGASSSILISDRPVTIGSDIYNPWLKTVGKIKFSLPLLPGLGRLADCELEINRNSTTDNLLTSALHGKTVLIWQWFEGLTDADKAARANLIVDEISGVTQSTFILRCISPEKKLHTTIPTLDLNKTDFPNLPEGNVGIPRPIVFGDQRYLKADGSKYPGTSTPKEYQFEEYAQCIKPFRAPFPAPWIDNVTSEADSLKQKFLPHESVDSLSVLTDTTTTLEGQEFWRYISEWDVYGFKRNNTADKKGWTAVQSGGKLRIDSNYFLTGATDAGGQFTTTYVLGDHAYVDNQVSTFANCIDVDPSTLSTITTTSAVKQLSIVFPSKPILDWTQAKRYVTFSVFNLGSGESLTIYHGIIGGGAHASIATISGPVTAANAYQEIATTLSDITDENGATPPINRLEGYYVQIVLGTFPSSCDIDGLAIKFVFIDNSRAKFPSRFNPTWNRGKIGKGRQFKHPFDLTRSFPPDFSQDYFFNTKGLDVNIDTKAYNVSHPIFILQYLWRKILGYSATELGYASIGNAYTWLATSGEGGSGPFSNSWRTFSRSLSGFQSAEEIIGQLAQEMGCWIWWGAEGVWQIMPFNFSNFLTTNIRVFSDSKADASSGASINPMSNFKFNKSRRIYNRFEFEYDWEYARQNYRSKKLFTKADYTELQTSYDNHGFEELFPLNTLDWHRVSGTVDNLYSMLWPALTTPRIEIEFDTTLCASHLEVGDNIKVDHTAQTWAAPTSTTGKEFQILEHEQTGNVIHIKAVEIIP